MSVLSLDARPPFPRASGGYTAGHGPACTSTGERVSGLYEAAPSDFNRETYRRGRASFDAVWAGIRELIERCWSETRNTGGQGVDSGSLSTRPQDPPCPASAAAGNPSVPSGTNREGLT